MRDTPSEAAVRNATGHGWDHWFAVLDRGPPALDHTGRAAWFARVHPELDGWWVQSITVAFEKERGLRMRGQTHAGDFQASVQRSFAGGPDAAWGLLVESPWLAGASWDEGATFPDPEGGSIVVRAVRPAKLLRFWRETTRGRRIVEVSLAPQAHSTAIRFMESKLADPSEWEQSRRRWTAALETLAG